MGLRLSFVKPENFLSEEQLKALPTPKLFYHFRCIRAAESCILSHWGKRCCEICNEYIGSDWENDVAKYARPYGEYLKKVKAVLNSRPDQFTHRLPKSQLQGNRKPRYIKRRLQKL